MMRRATRLLSAGAGYGKKDWYHADGEDPNKMHDYMTLQTACGMFGYQLSDKIERAELKKRFKKLAIQHHPDSGGSEAGFRKLVEAHKLLQEARHDKGGTEGRYNFHKARSPREQNKSTTKPTKESPFGEEDENDKKFDKTDIAIFIVIVSIAAFFYFGRMLDLNGRLQRSRGRLTEEEMADASKLLGNNDWHPWTASQRERDTMDQLAVIQGSVREDVAAEKARLKGQLAPSPFSR